MMLQCKQMVWVLPVVLAVGGLITLAPAQQPTITPTAKELNKAFDVDASQWTARFEHEGRAIYDKRYEVLDAMHLRPGMNVADIGAGSGLFARLMAQRVAPGGMVYAVDISKNMIDHITSVAEQRENREFEGRARRPALAAAGTPQPRFGMHYRPLPSFRIPARHASRDREGLAAGWRVGIDRFQTDRRSL